MDRITYSPTARSTPAKPSTVGRRSCSGADLRTLDLPRVAARALQTVERRVPNPRIEPGRSERRLRRRTRPVPGYFPQACSIESQGYRQYDTEQSQLTQRRRSRSYRFEMPTLVARQSAACQDQWRGGLAQSHPQLAVASP